MDFGMDYVSENVRQLREAIDENCKALKKMYAELDELKAMRDNPDIEYSAYSNKINTLADGIWELESYLANLAWEDFKYRSSKFGYFSIIESHFPSICPEGRLIGYKKAILRNNVRVIVELEIPADAKRSSAFGRKCRCAKAIVKAIRHVSGGNETQSTAYSIRTYKNQNYFNDQFAYQVGKEVRPDFFDENRFNECSHGIHFFLTKEEAIEYEY